MNAATQQQSKAATPVVALKTKERLTGFGLVESIAFCGKELASVILGRDADSIAPARLEPDGTAVVISSGQRADGLLLRKKNMNLQTRMECIEQKMVPFANIRGLDYGE